MRRRLTVALGAVALGWLACPAPAADPGMDAAVDAAAQPASIQNAAPSVLARGQAADAGSDTGYGHFLGGAGAYILKAHIEKDRAWEKSLQIKSTSEFNGHSEVVDFNYDYEGAPKVWLGWVSDAGWGARFSYFHFDTTGKAPAGTLSPDENPAGVIGNSQDGTTLHPAQPLGEYALQFNTSFLEPDRRAGVLGGGTDVLTVSSRVDLDVWDLEAIEEFRAGSWLLTLAGGVRHADLAEFYDASKRNTLDVAGTDIRTLRSSHRFTGTGPTVDIEAHWLLGNTGLGLYGNGRASVLFGTRRQFVYATSSGLIFNPDEGIFVGPFLGANTLQKDDVLPVTEGEIGVEWSKDLGGYRPFVQVGVVGQAWFNALSNNEPHNEPGNEHPTSATDNGLFSLFGVTITAGVNF